MQLRWPVHILTDWMKIGCKFHSIEAWNSFTDGEIDAMAPNALEFWKTYKDMLISVHNTMKQQTQENGK